MQPPNEPAMYKVFDDAKAAVRNTQGVNDTMKEACVGSLQFTLLEELQPRLVNNSIYQCALGSRQCEESEFLLITITSLQNQQQCPDDTFPEMWKTIDELDTVFKQTCCNSDFCNQPPSPAEICGSMSIFQPLSLLIIANFFVTLLLGQ